MGDENTRNGRRMPGDDRHEMTRRTRSADRTADAVFSGQVPPGCEDLADVAALADVLRAAVTPPAPNGELAAILAEGLPVGAEEVVFMAAGDTRTRSGSPSGTTKVLPSVRTRLRVAARAGAAGMLLIAATTGAAAAELLPAAAQDAVSGVVGAVTPFELPTSADRTDAGAPAEVPAEVPTDVPEDRGGDTHGQDVSDAATGNTELQGCERGQDIAELAGGQPAGCVEDPGAADDVPRMEPPRQRLDTAGEAAGDAGQQGRETADDAVTSRRGPAASDDASTRGAGVAEQKVAEAGSEKAEASTSERGASDDAGDVPAGTPPVTPGPQTAEAPPAGGRP